MQELSLPDKLEKSVQDFIQRLKDTYQDGLISVILYGSAASGEFIDKHSNLNLLVILKNTDLENLKKAASLTNKFRMINPLFFTEKYINSSTDIFPIEFLDMQENYLILYCRYVLKDINIDIKNLIFQCEQELKSKLINLRQLYLTANKDEPALRRLLFKSFTSVLHILRNVLRLKGRKPPYKKEDILKEVALEFEFDSKNWNKILAAKNKQIKLSQKDTEGLFVNFVRELENIVETVDRL